MSNVKILRRPSNDATKETSLSRYSDKVERCLREGGIDFDEIFFSIDASSGYLDLFVHGLIKPFVSCIKAGSKKNVILATDELCGIFFPFMRGRKIAVIHHVPNKGEYRGGVYHTLWKLVSKTSLKHADAIIAISEQTKEEMLERFKANPEKVVLITNGADNIFDIRKEVKKEKTIGCMGALIQRKNVLSTIQAFKLLTDYPGMSDHSLEICGKGPEKGKLLEAAADLGISEKVKFVSDLDKDEIVRFYNRSELIFNTSLHEGIGMVTLEAQKCGVPVLHLEEAKIPKEVTKYSIACRDDADMAEKAYGLLSNREEYENTAKTSKEYADSYGNDFCKQYIKIIHGAK
ncbi:MAG: glycosyltransferase [Candidatus Methanoplasma sp.]|nr:glycosyltransferase [Candidatus Methanoplasma sp.]